MAITRIPDSDKPIIVSLTKFSNTELDQLVSVFDGDSIIAFDDYTQRQVPETLDLKNVNPEELIRVIITLFLSWKRSNNPKDNFILDIINLLQSEIKDLDVDKLKSNLSYILRHDSSLGITLSAIDLFSQQQRIVNNTKLLTDVRHSFTKNDEPIPEYGIIFHNLEIIYHENDEIKTLYVAFNSGDLSELKQNINRALKKELALKTSKFSTVKLYSIEG